MGMINIRCPSCKAVHQWYTGSKDQRCRDCMSKENPTELRSIAKQEIKAVVEKMFELFADLNLNSDTVFCALQVSLETMEEQFGYSLDAEKARNDGNH